MESPRADPDVPARNQHDLPFVEHVRSLRSREVSIYHATGHQLGAAASPEILELLGPDVFASSHWLNATAYDAALREAELLAADAWGSDRSFYLVDGSSSGNHAIFLAALRPGDDVIISRDLHWSMLVALIMCGARPHYVAPRVHPELDISTGIAPEDVERALIAQPNARLVAIVSPSFSGVASDLKGIVDVAHARDVPVYIDEAWGAHCHFHADLPASAMASGADASVSSVHKLLSSLTQGSVLHMRGSRLDSRRVVQAVHMTQTTTPLYPIVASLDAARHQMATQGEALLRRTIDLSLDAKGRLARLPGLDMIDAGRLGIDERFLDPTKLVVDVHGWGMTGFEVHQQLIDRFEVAVEMGDHRGIIGNFNTGHSQADIDRLVSALATIAQDVEMSRDAVSPVRSSGAAIAAAPQVMTPRDAYFAESEMVQLADAIDHVVADIVTPYPPGIPILVPGELVTPEKVEYLLELDRIGIGTYGSMAHRAGMVQVVKRPTA